MDLGVGICLPAKKSGGLFTAANKYKIKVKIGDAFEYTFKDPVEEKHSYNRWSDRLQQQTFNSSYQSIDEMEKVFVYLMDGDKQVCFWKGDIAQFKDPNPKFKWLHMKADKSVGAIEHDYEAGMIQFKMSINDETLNGPADFKSMASWKKMPPKRLESVKIRCFIFQCRDIPAADADGSSDSYISIWNPDGKAEVKTRIIEDSLNPIYFETLEMLYDMADLDNSPPIVLDIWDQDKGVFGSESFDFLGRCTVYLNEASTNPLSEQRSKSKEYVDSCNKVPLPKWHPIRMGFDESLPSCGEVLCSFVIVQDDFDFKTPVKQHKLANIIPMKEYNVEINMLGLRNLESFGLMPVRKPYIRFRIKSLLPPEKAQAVTDIDTDPNANGPNPNINTTLSFSILLPEDELYCPTLACDVFDFVYKGLAQPLLGTMQIPIGKMKTEAKNARLKMNQEMDEIIADLEKHNSMSDGSLRLQIEKNKSSVVNLSK